MPAIISGFVSRNNWKLSHRGNISEERETNPFQPRHPLPRIHHFGDARIDDLPDDETYATIAYEISQGSEIS